MFWLRLLFWLWRGAGITVGIKRGSLVTNFYEFGKLVQISDSWPGVFARWQQKWPVLILSVGKFKSVDTFIYMWLYIDRGIVNIRCRVLAEVGGWAYFDRCDLGWESYQLLCCGARRKIAGRNNRLKSLTGWGTRKALRFVARGEHQILLQGHFCITYIDG